MRNRTRSLTALASAAVLATGAVAGISASANATFKPTKTLGSNQALALAADGATLSSFPLSLPILDRKIGKVSGLAGDTKLIGIDFRVQDRKFYGVGNAGGVYTIDTGNAKATKVSQLTVALTGTSFGVDFNPAADRLRVVSDTGQNLRHNVNAGGTTLVDGPLAYVPGTPAAGVTAAGYTNNDLNAATATALLDVDTTLDQVALQVPANDGLLSATGQLGIKVGPTAGFDILSSVKSGITVGNTGYAVLTADGAKKPSLYKVDLLSGRATKVGTYLSSVADLAVVQPK